MGGLVKQPIRIVAGLETGQRKTVHSIRFVSYLATSPLKNNIYFRNQLYVSKWDGFKDRRSRMRGGLTHNIEVGYEQDYLLK